MTGIFASLNFCSSGIGGLAVECREADGRRVLVELGLEHLHLLVDLGLGLGPFEVDLDVLLGCLSLGALLDGLPELVLETL